MKRTEATHEANKRGIIHLGAPVCMLIVYKEELEK